MSNTCIVFDCTSGEADGGELGHFFRVPRDLELQRQWAQAIPKVKEPLTTEHLVCDKHFLESDMIRYYIVKDDAGIVVKKVPYAYPRLTDTAVPSVFPGFELRQNEGNPEPVQRTIGPDVVIYDNPVTDLYTHTLIYPMWPGPSYNGHAVCHGENTRPEPVDQITNNNSTHNETSTVISGPEGTAHDSANLPATVATPSNDGQNVVNGISGDSTLPGGDISQTVTSPPNIAIDGTTDIAAQITASSGDNQIVGNGLSEPPGMVDTAAIGNTFFPQTDTTTDTMTLVGSTPNPEWGNVIVDEPVSTFSETCISYVPPVAVDGGCCANDNGDCCCGDCGLDCNCCDDCNCDGCGDCDCGGCGDCDCGGLDCSGVDCGGCDCGGCTIM